MRIAPTRRSTCRLAGGEVPCAIETPAIRRRELVGERDGSRRCRSSRSTPTCSTWQTQRLRRPGLCDDQRRFVVPSGRTSSSTIPSSSSSSVGLASGGAASGFFHRVVALVSVGVVGDAGGEWPGTRSHRPRLERPGGAVLLIVDVVDDPDGARGRGRRAGRDRVPAQPPSCAPGLEAGRACRSRAPLRRTAAPRTAGTALARHVGEQRHLQRSRGRISGRGAGSSPPDVPRSLYRRQVASGSPRAGASSSARWPASGPARRAAGRRSATTLARPSQSAEVAPLGALFVRTSSRTSAPACSYIEVVAEVEELAVRRAATRRSCRSE